jgi:hypothetical protein
MGGGGPPQRLLSMTRLARLRAARASEQVETEAPEWWSWRCS